jgi:hypothetical protein
MRQELPHGTRWHRYDGVTVPGVTVLLNQRALPVAWLVHDVRVLLEEDILRTVRGERTDATFDPMAQALSPRPIAGVLPAVAAEPSVEVVSYDADEIQLDASPATDALLVTSELFHPGWRAWIDGRRVGIENVNAGFRAVTVPAGRHRVVLRYRPLSQRLGYAIGVACVVGLGVSWIGRRRIASHAATSSHASGPSSAGTKPGVA